VVYELKCQELRSARYFYNLTYAFEDDWWYDTLSLMSLFGNCFLFLVIWLNKKLQVHPQKLFMYIALVDAS